MPDIDAEQDPFSTAMDRAMRVRQSDRTANFNTEEVEDRVARTARPIDEIRRRAREAFEARFPTVRSN